jgi:hypothetical protein
MLETSLAFTIGKVRFSEPEGGRQGRVSKSHLLRGYEHLGDSHYCH